MVIPTVVEGTGMLYYMFTRLKRMEDNESEIFLISKPTQNPQKLVAA